MKLLKLSQRGIAHYIVPLVVILAVAIGGIAYIAIDHADSLSSVPTDYQFLGATSTNETKVKFYACLIDYSAKKWEVDGLAVMSPAVGDASSYTFKLMLTNKGQGGSVESNTWGRYVTPLSSRVQMSFAANNSANITPVLLAPKAHPVTSGSGVQPIYAGGLTNC